MIVGVVGAGGIGSYYAGILARSGVSVRLLARGDHLSVMRTRGLEVRTPDERFTVSLEATDDGGRLAGTDYVIVAVKSYSLGEVGPALVGAARSGAAIVPLLNGVDVAERLEHLGVPRANVIAGLAAVSLVRTAPGVVERRSPFDRVVLGELDRGPREGVARDRVARLVDALVAAGSTAEVSDDIQRALWLKFAFIVPMNVACGLPRRPVGGALSTERGRELIAGALHEVVLVSRAGPAPLSDDDETKIRGDLLALPPAMQPSFLLDLERGGPTELDSLVGTVARLGREHGLPTPIHDVATAAFEIATLPRAS